jgi:phage repressor protein C with HTH and peptisase S24 domain
VEVPEFYSENRVQEVERKWAASLGPKHAALIMAGKLTAVALLDTTAGYPEHVAASREPQGRLEVVMQLPPFGPEFTGARLFALRVNGDSMQAAGGEGFRPGEVVVFSTIPEVKAGDFAFVTLQDGSMFRKVESLGADSAKFIPLNHTYQERVAPRLEIVRMWKLVRHLRSY